MRYKSVIAGLLLIACVLAAFVYFQTRGEESAYVALIGGKEIEYPEYSVYLWAQKNRFENQAGEDIWEMELNGEPTENVAKQYALNTIVQVKVTAAQSSRLGIHLNGEELAYARMVAESFIQEEYVAASGITLEQLIGIMEEEALYQKIYEELTKNLSVSEAEFLAYAELEENVGVDRNQLYQVYLDMKKEEVFNQEYIKWRDEVNVEKNQAVWDAIRINPKLDTGQE